MYVNIQEVVKIVQALKWQKDKDLGSISTVHWSDLYHVQLFQTDIGENNNQDAEKKVEAKRQCDFRKDRSH